MLYIADHQNRNRNDLNFYKIYNLESTFIEIIYPNKSNIIVRWGHSKGVFVVLGGEWGESLKSELKRTGGGSVKNICMFALRKKLPDFQTGGNVLSDRLLDSC